MDNLYLNAPKAGVLLGKDEDSGKIPGNRLWLNPWGIDARVRFGD